MGYNIFTNRPYAALTDCEQSDQRGAIAKWLRRQIPDLQAKVHVQARITKYCTALLVKGSLRFAQVSRVFHSSGVDKISTVSAGDKVFADCRYDA